MIEVKYRVWNVISHRMDVKTEMRFCDGKSVCTTRNEGGNGDPVQLIEMMYTGIYDRDGADICEGDVVDFGDGNATPVVRDEGSFFGKIPAGEIIPLSQLITHPTKAKVLGNIYENFESQ